MTPPETATAEALAGPAHAPTVVELAAIEAELARIERQPFTAALSVPALVRRVLRLLAALNRRLTALERRP